MKLISFIPVIAAFAYGGALAASSKPSVLGRAADNLTVYETLDIKLTNGKTMTAHNMSPKEVADSVQYCCLVHNECCGFCC